jgi:DNA primase
VVEEARRESEDRETVPVVTWRGLVRYQDAAAVDLRVAVLPPGRDPDEVIRADAEAWRQLIASARPVLDYRFEAAASRHDLSAPRGRSEAVQELLPLLEPISDPVVRAHYLQRLSRLSLVKEEELSRMVGRRRRSGRAGEAEAAAASLGDTRGETRPEGFLLALLLRFPHVRQAGLEVPAELFWESANREVLGAWKRAPELDVVKESLPEELKGHLERLISWRLPEYGAKEAEAALLDCLKTIDKRHNRAEAEANTALLAAKEEELGSSVLVEAAVSDSEPENDMMKEGIGVLRTGQEIGQRIHAGERKEEGGETAETVIDG